MAFFSLVYYPRWNKLGSEAELSCDVSGYYWYLPSLFIYHDIAHQGFADKVIKKYQPSTDFSQGFRVDNGNYVLKYSSGLAVMYLPFFAVGHVAAGMFGYPQDGFSLPYALAIQLGALLVAIIGIWYLRRLMLRYYEDKVVAILLLLLVVGTNYLNAAVIDGGMSHNWLFTVYVFLLLNTVYFYETFKVKYAVRIGLLVGLATLTRPTDALSVVIPLLWGMNSISIPAIKQRFVLLGQQYKSLLVAVGCAALVISVQFVYWKVVSGHWMVYSYQDQHFDFLAPHFRDYTFSFRTGWLLYAPMLSLAVVGLLPFLRNGNNRVAIITFLLINYYIVCAWSIWWYAGRAMVQSYPLLMFPMAALIEHIIKRRALIYIFNPLILFFIYMNIWFTHQSHRGGLYDTTTMSKLYYMRVAGRWHVPANTVVLRDNTELYEGGQPNMHELYSPRFERDSTGSSYCRIAGNTPDMVEYKFAAPAVRYEWLRMSADFKCKKGESEIWNMPQLVGRIYKGGVKQKENMLRINRLLGNNEIRNISLDMNVSGIEYDSISVGIWNGASDKDLWIDNIKVVGFDGK